MRKLLIAVAASAFALGACKTIDRSQGRKIRSTTKVRRSALAPVRSSARSAAGRQDRAARVDRCRRGCACRRRGGAYMDKQEATAQQIQGPACR